jgi:hypothetical protein
MTIENMFHTNLWDKAKSQGAKVAEMSAKLKSGKK